MTKTADRNHVRHRECELSEALLHHGVTAVPPESLHGRYALASRARRVRDNFLRNGKGTAVEIAEVISRAVRLHSLEAALRTVGLPAKELLEESYLSKRFACKRCHEFVCNGKLANVTSFVTELRREHTSRRMNLDAALQAQRVTLDDYSKSDHYSSFDLDKFLKIGLGNVEVLASRIAEGVRKDSLCKVGLSPDFIERDPRAKSFIAGKDPLQSPKSLADAVLNECNQREACLSRTLANEIIDLDRLLPRSEAKKAFDDFVASGDISHVSEQAISIARAWRHEAMIQELKRQGWWAAQDALANYDFRASLHDNSCTAGRRFEGASGQLYSDVKHTMRQFILGQVLTTPEELVSALLAESKARTQVVDNALSHRGFCVDAAQFRAPQAYHSFCHFNQGSLEEVIMEFERACRTQEVCQELRKKKLIKFDLFSGLKSQNVDDRIALYIDGGTNFSSALELVETICAERNARSAELNGLLVSSGLPSMQAARTNDVYNVRGNVRNLCQDYINHGKGTAKAVIEVVDRKLRCELLIHEFRNLPSEGPRHWVQSPGFVGNPIKQCTNYSILCLKVALGTSRSFPHISEQITKLIGSFDSSEQIRAFVQLDGARTAQTAKRLVAALDRERYRRCEELTIDISATDSEFFYVGLHYETSRKVQKYIDKGVGCKVEIKAKLDAAYREWLLEERKDALRDALYDISSGLMSVVNNCLPRSYGVLEDDSSSERSAADVQTRIDQETPQAYAEILTSCAAFLRGEQKNLDVLIEDLKKKRDDRKKILDRNLNADAVIRHVFAQGRNQSIDCLGCPLGSTSKAIHKFVDLGFGSIEGIIQHARSEIQMQVLRKAIEEHGVDPHIANIDFGCIAFASTSFSSKVQIQKAADTLAKSLESARRRRYAELVAACQEAGVAVPEICEMSDFESDLESDCDSALQSDPDKVCKARSFVEYNVGSSADVVCRIQRGNRAESLRSALAQSSSVWKTWSARAIATWSRENRQCQMFVNGCLWDLLTDTKIDKAEQLVELLEQQAGQEAFQNEFSEPFDDSDFDDGYHELGGTLGDMYPDYGCGDDHFDRMIEAYEDSRS